MPQSSAAVLYNPNPMFDAVLSRHRIKNDAALCRALQVPPPVISKARHLRMPVGDRIMLRLVELLDEDIKIIRAELHAHPVN